MLKSNSLFMIIPGVILAVFVAIPSVFLGQLYKPIGAVAYAIIIGFLIRNIFGLKPIFETGNKFAIKKLLRLAIVLLGVRLYFVDILKIGMSSILIIICCIVCAIGLTMYIAKLFKLPKKIGILIGVGTTICGNSAIIATAPIIEAEDEDVAFAVSTITLFGLIAVLLYPILGRFLSMSDTTFGTWAGTAINDTSQVVTAGYIFSEDAGNVATVVKLTRNLFIVPVIILMGFICNRNRPQGETKKEANFLQYFPLFVLGFIAMGILRSMDVFSLKGIFLIKETSSYLIVICVAAIGLGTSLKSMKKVGWVPFYVGLCASTTMAVLSYVLIRVFNI
ncbi:MAG: YeiH family protein [Sedimentisphaerales bacterium]